MKMNLFYVQLNDTYFDYFIKESMQINLLINYNQERYYNVFV